jgi:primosomal protein N' (replication factor Y)
MEELTRALKASAPPGVFLHGPAPAPVSKIRNLYRYHLRLRSGSPRPLQALWQAVAPTLPPPGEVELAIDVDPINLL